MSMINYSYTLGFQVDGQPIPDPSSFSGAESALDASGGRDMSGTLHRCMVATKHPLKLEWSAMDWSMMKVILPMVSKESFTFTYPNPITGMTEITAYAGDREWDIIRNPGIGGTDGYIGKLSFSVIEF